MTPEQAKKLGEYRLQRKQSQGQRNKDLGEKKATHDWHSEFVYTGGPGIARSAGHWSPSHCKKCGIPFLRFRAFPLSCNEVLVQKGVMKPCTPEDNQCS